MRAAFLLAILVVAAAGCSSAPEGPVATTTPAADIGMMATPPTLHVGQWWTYTTTGGRAGDPTMTIVVSGETGTDYTMDTKDPNLAWADHQQDISYLGPQRKADLAGSQGSDRVQFFQWPLADGKTWTTMWDHETKTILVKALGAGKFDLTATNSSGVYAHYGYDEAVGWFNALHFVAPDGSPKFSATLQSHGGNFTEDLVRWDADVVVDTQGDLSQVTPGTITYDVPTTATDVWVDVEIVCTQGFAGAGTAPFPFVGTLVGTDDRGAGNPGSQCPYDEAFHGVAGAVGAATPGASGETWGYDLIGGPATVGTYDFAIYIRTAAPFKAGSAPQ